MSEEKKYYEIDAQHVVLTNFECDDGWILDFGGGGEGIIGQLKGAQVVAVDRLASELKEALDAGSRALPIIMDGKDLQFLDNTFATATAFYSMMYVPVENLPSIFAELYRVLKPEGQLIIWESEFENPLDSKYNIAAFELTVALPNSKIIETGYGTRKRKQTMNEYLKIAQKAGFQCEQKNQQKNQFVLTLRKPSPN